MADARTLENRRQWERKPVLREIYADLYRKMQAQCVPGRTLEIGGGSGNFKRFRDDVVSSDIAHAPWLDLVCDAQRLPFTSNAFSNIVMFDVLHHIEHPGSFFREAERVLVPGGRIVMVEPGITLLSWFFYRFLHQEPVVMAADPLTEGTPTPGRDPYASNQAIPTLIASRYSARFHRRFPGLAVVTVQWLSLFAYPLSGGFKSWCLVPGAAVKKLLQMEDAISGSVGRLMGFRMVMTVVKTKWSGEEPGSAGSARKG